MSDPLTGDNRGPVEEVRQPGERANSDESLRD